LERDAAAAGVRDSLYDKDTDLVDCEEVDPRVEGALDTLNRSMSRVNEAESALIQARRRARQVETEQRRLCQARAVASSLLWAHDPLQEAYNKLSRRSRDALSVSLRENQQERTRLSARAFQHAHDAHAAAKAAAKRLEYSLAQFSGAAPAD